MVLALALVLVVRPLAGWLALTVMARDEDKDGGLDRGEAAAVAFFGVRGVGSLYYLAFALAHGVEGEVATRLMSVTLWTVAASVVVHGTSVTPLMNRYRAWAERRRPAAEGAP